MWEKITDKQALALKPEKLPEVEPELQKPPSRPMVWIYPKSSYRKITQDIEESLINWISVRAWITLYKTTSDREGTDHFIQYCFEIDESLIQGKNYRSFDDLHLVYGAPDYATWMVNTYKQGGTFTILYDADNPLKHEIFGDLELYIEQDLVQISEKIKNSKDTNHLDMLSLQFIKILIGPLRGIGDRWDEYFDLMKRINLADNNEIYNADKSLHVLKNIIPENNYDKEALAELSELCKEFIPGIWAAR